MLRLRLWLPVPQVLVHADHAPKLDMTQLIGQAWLLQLAVSCKTGQATPP